MEVFKCRNGRHWKETLKHRPLYRMTRGDVAWFIMGHVLLLPLALFVLLFTFLCLPAYWVWWRIRLRYGAPPEMHGEAQKILQDPKVNVGFVDGIRPQDQPVVSIVMPFYNRENWVDWSVGSVLRQNLPPGFLAEIIAVDNGSSDNTVEKLKRHPVRLIHCKERGPGAARNAGIAAARAPVIAFIDSDCIADENWLINVTDSFRDPRVLIAGGRILSLEDDGFVASFVNHEAVLSNQRFFAGSAYFPRFFATANAAYRKEALEKVGGFDNKLWMSEDADLSWRVLDIGGKMAYRHDAVVFHQHRTSLRGFFRQSIDYGAASVAIFAKHRSKLQATGVIAWKNIRDIAWAPFQLVTDQFLAKNKFNRHRELLYALWRLGFTYGSIRESIKRRIWFF